MLHSSTPETADARTHLRVIRDEDAPPYDGDPPRARRHMTVIADETVERAFALGLAANGLYCYLERRVGKDGRWSSTLGDIAVACRQTIRHVRDATKTLEEAGLIERETIYGRGDVPVGVVFYLPQHTQAQSPRTYYAEPTPEPTPEPSCARRQEEVITSKGSTPLTPQANKVPIYSDDFEQTFWAVYPKGHGSKKDSYAVWKRLSAEDRDAAVSGIAVWKQSRRWQEGYVKDAERYLGKRLWENPPISEERAPTMNGHDKSARARAAIDAYLEIAGIKRHDD